MILHSTAASSQTVPVRNFTTNDGLPNMGVRCIFKDSRDLLWIGTNTGLCSYDGKTFRVFKSSEGMTASQAWSIAEDEDGNMWFGSYGEGLFKYDGRKFRRFTRRNGLCDDRVRILKYSEKFHRLIAGTCNGVSIVIDDSISSPFPQLAHLITGVQEAGECIIIISDRHEINPVRYFPKENKIAGYAAGDIKHRYASYSFIISSNGDTAFSASDNGVKIFTDKGIVENYSIGKVFSMTEDKRGDLWFAAWSYPTVKLHGGVFKYDGTKFTN